MPLNLRSRIKFFNSFFGLTRRFKVIIFSEIFEALTYPEWFSIYLKKDLKANDMDIGLVNAVRGAVNLILQQLVTDNQYPAVTGNPLKGPAAAFNILLNRYGKVQGITE